MTPAERAQHLFDQMHDIQPATLRFKEASRLRAKESAIVAANAIIAAGPTELASFKRHSTSDYWQEVLNHLKQM